MKIKTDSKFYTVLAILLVIAFAPISASVFAQSVNDEGDDSQVETTKNEEFDEQKDLREQMRDEFKTLEEQMKEKRHQLNEEFRELRDQMKDELKNEELTDDERKELRKEMHEQLKELREQTKEKRNHLQEEFKQFKDDRFSEFNEMFPKHIRPDISDRPTIPDRDSNVKFTGETNGWTIIDGQAYSSSIVLTGNAYRASDGAWKITSDGKITIGDKIGTLDLTGHARGHNIVLQGTGELGGESVRLMLKGHYAPTNEDGVFAIAFTQAAFQNIDSGERIGMMQVGQIKIENLNSESIPETEPTTSNELAIPLDLA